MLKKELNILKEWLGIVMYLIGATLQLLMGSLAILSYLLVVCIVATRESAGQMLIKVTKAASDEIFVCGSTVDDVWIITSLVANQLAASCTVVTSTSTATTNTTSVSAVSGSTTSGSGSSSSSGSGGAGY